MVGPGATGCRVRTAVGPVCEHGRMDRRTRVLVVAIVVSFIAFLDGAVINVALPSLAAELGGGLVLQQWAVDAYLLTLGSLILLAGSLSDSFGRLRIIRIGLYGFAATSVLCALAPTGVVFVIGRALQGAAGALLVPSSLALIIATFSRAEQGRAIGRWTAWTTAAFLIGPLFGGVLVDLASWRLAFWINLVPIVAVLVLMRVLGRDEPNPNRERIDWAGAALCVVGLGGTVFALIEQGRFGWDSPVVFVPLVVGLLALLAFVLWERRAPQPMLPLSLFRARNFAAGNLATFFIYASFSLGPFVMTIFLQETGGFSATLAGLATLPPTIMLVLLGSRFGGLSTRFGPRIFMTLGPIIVAVGYLLTLSVQPDLNYWLQFLPRNPHRRIRHGDDRGTAHGGDPRCGGSRTGGHRLRREQRGRTHRRPRGGREPRRDRWYAARRRRISPGRHRHRGLPGGRRRHLVVRHPQPRADAGCHRRDPATRGAVDRHRARATAHGRVKRDRASRGPPVVAAADAAQPAVAPASVGTTRPTSSAAASSAAIRSAVRSFDVLEADREAHDAGARLRRRRRPGRCVERRRDAERASRHRRARRRASMSSHDSVNRAAAS